MKQEPVDVHEHGSHGGSNAAREKIGKRDERWILGLHHVEYFFLSIESAYDMFIIKKNATRPGMYINMRNYNRRGHSSWISSFSICFRKKPSLIRSTQDPISCIEVF